VSYTSKLMAQPGRPVVGAQTYHHSVGLKFYVLQQLYLLTYSFHGSTVLEEF
jgi:hypothetical protein